MKKNLIDIKNVTIGSDPEFFIVDKNGEAYPSTHIFKGTKEFPEDKGDGYAILKDNVLVEGNIPPASTKEQFIEFMKFLKDSINEILEIGGMKLYASDSMDYKPRFLQNAEANEFGCSSYKNAWQLGSFAAANMSRFNKRVAGFHIHIGYKLEDEGYITKSSMNRYIAKAFDYFVVFPSRQYHSDPFREEYYGGYGNYRDTAYGNECRALGGFFTDDKYLGWTYDQTIKAIEYCSNPDNLPKLDQVDVLETKNLDLANKYYKILEIDLNDQLIK